MAAWSVHLLTASGALWGLLALDAIARARPATAMAWMALAVVVDGVDGVLARLAHVKEVLPHVDGALLDNLIDYLNYVIVPSYLMVRAGWLPERFALAAVAMICVASAFQFIHERAKTPDHFFRGFPCYWNVVALYFLLLQPDEWVALALVITLAALAVTPLRFVYPTRTPRLRRTTLTLLAAWSALVLWLLWRYPHHSLFWTIASLAFGLYYVLLGLWLQRRPAAGGP
jgi:phosphatidylcholine synthase